MGQLSNECRAKFDATSNNSEHVKMLAEYVLFRECLRAYGVPNYNKSDGLALAGQLLQTTAEDTLISYGLNEFMQNSILSAMSEAELSLIDASGDVDNTTCAINWRGIGCFVQRFFGKDCAPVMADPFYDKLPYGMTGTVQPVTPAPGTPGISPVGLETQDKGMNWWLWGGVAAVCGLAAWGVTRK